LSPCQAVQEQSRMEPEEEAQGGLANGNAPTAVWFAGALTSTWTPRRLALR
jgi:hypothetical protein